MQDLTTLRKCGSKNKLSHHMGCEPLQRSSVWFLAATEGACESCGAQARTGLVVGVAAAVTLAAPILIPAVPVATALPL
eukprot:6083119-Amphidinium_carterae.1